MDQWVLGLPDSRIRGPEVSFREPGHRNGIKAVTKIRAFMDKKSVFWTGVIVLVIALIVIAWLTDPFGLTPDGRKYAPDQNGHVQEPSGNAREPGGYAQKPPGPAEEMGHASESDTVPGPNGPTWRPAELFPATRVYQGPDFRLEDMDGNRLLLSDYEGYIIVLNLWATWCPPCRDEVPAL